MHCPYCGKEISENAKVCPYCGREQKRKKAKEEKVLEAKSPEAAKPVVEAQAAAVPIVEPSKKDKVAKKEVVAEQQSEDTKADSILPKSPKGMPAWVWAIAGLLVLALIITFVSGGGQETSPTERAAVVDSGAGESNTQSSSSTYPFDDAVGNWEATDTDGSHLELVIRSRGDGNFSLRYLDDETSAVCPGQSFEANVSEYTNTNSFGPFNSSGSCELGEVINFSYGVKYLPESDQIEDSYGIVYDRQ